MKTYAVGGCVRDDCSAARDRPYWVVVGATPRRDGCPSGFARSAPISLVFPASRDARGYAARAHRAQDGPPGNKGFVFHASPNVTLEEDCAGATSPSTAIARAETARSSTPRGREDLRLGVLRHVGEAFAEDPVPASCAWPASPARFGFAWTGNDGAHARDGSFRQADHLVPERVWQEIARGLQSRGRHA